MLDLIEKSLINGKWVPITRRGRDGVYGSNKVRKADFELGPRLKTANLDTNEHVIWPGAMRNGYGLKKIPGKGNNSTINAHRYVWEKYYGKKIPKGMAIDHKCRERRCINPKHLEVVTHSENKTREWANRKGNWDTKKGTYIKKMDPRLEYRQKKFKQAPSVDAKRIKPKLNISTRESKVMAPSAKKILRPLRSYSS